MQVGRVSDAANARRVQTPVQTSAVCLLGQRRPRRSRCRRSLPDRRSGTPFGGPRLIFLRFVPPRRCLPERRSASSAGSWWRGAPRRTRVHSVRANRMPRRNHPPTHGTAQGAVIQTGRNLSGSVGSSMVLHPSIGRKSHDRPPLGDSEAVTGGAPRKQRPRGNCVSPKQTQMLRHSIGRVAQRCLPRPARSPLSEPV